MSIRKRLLVWLLSGLTAAMTLSAVMTFRRLREEIRMMQDFEMEQIAGSLRSQGDTGKFKSLSEGREDVRRSDEAAEDPDFIMQIWSRDGKLLSSSSPAMALPLATGDGFSEAKWKGETWRIFRLADADHFTEVAQNLDVREEDAIAIAWRALGPMFALSLLFAVAIWFIVGRALKPLEKVVSEIQHRKSTLLTPISTESLPAELIPVVLALNDLLVRLSAALDGQRRFLADAAHQLRTPLAALGLQAQILEKSDRGQEREQAALELRSGVMRASHLIQQLLEMARLEPGAATPHYEKIRLDEIARQTVVAFEPLASAKDIDLGISKTTPLTVTGNPAELAVLLSNLVDNAIRYTPKGGAVDVSVEHANGQAILNVSDTGPGIPLDQRSRVFERFYRPPGQAEPGSGLGLAIVKSIADRHSAQIELENNRGSNGLLVHVKISDVK